jgi:Flp pilus assembly protein TadB
VNFPPRTLLALGVIVVFVCLALGTVLAVLRRRRVSRASMALAAVVVLGVAGLVTWITLLWPAYWD